MTTTATNLYNTASDTSKAINNIGTSNFNTWTLGFDMATQLIGMYNDYQQGRIQGERAEFQAKAQGSLQRTQLYNQTVPLYQQIGSQVRQMMNAQAMQYMNSGVDISQGTALYVLNHTKEQGDMKINEIRDNVNINIENISNMSVYNAQVGLTTGIMNGINNMTNRLGNTISRYQQAGVFNTNNNNNNNNTTGTGGNTNATTTK